MLSSEVKPWDSTLNQSKSIKHFVSKMFGRKLARPLRLLRPSVSESEQNGPSFSGMHPGKQECPESQDTGSANVFTQCILGAATFDGASVLCFKDFEARNSAINNLGEDVVITSEDNGIHKALEKSFNFFNAAACAKECLSFHALMASGFGCSLRCLVPGETKPQSRPPGALDPRDPLSL
jgi:hypothetical protein